MAGCDVTHLGSLQSRKRLTQGGALAIGEFEVSTNKKSRRSELGLITAPRFPEGRNKDRKCLLNVPGSGTASLFYFSLLSLNS